MEDTANGQNGQNVLLNVEEEHRPDLEPVPTRPLQTEELTVKEKVLKLENATSNYVKVKTKLRIT